VLCILVCLCARGGNDSTIQVAEYFHRFAQQDVKEVAARRAATFLQFTKEVNQQKFDFESKAKALLQWVQASIERFESQDLGSTLEESLAVVEQLRQFVLHEKPPKSAEKLDLENLYAEIQQKLLVSQASHERYACLHDLQLGVPFYLRCHRQQRVCSSSFLLPFCCLFAAAFSFPIFPLISISSLFSGARSRRVRVSRRILD
jgi:hypothetical protein